MDVSTVYDISLEKSRNTTILCLCVFLIGYGLGVFTLLFIIAFLDEREDVYSDIKYKKSLDTCIEWSFILESIEVKRLQSRRP